MKKTWNYVTTQEGLYKAASWLTWYLNQDTPGEEEPILGVDVETYRPDFDRTQFPNAYWNGDDWECRVRLLQIGTDPDLLFGDRQFVLDVKKLGIKLVRKVMKPILERAPWLTQGGQYECQVIPAILKIKPKHIIDLKIISQVFYAGDRLRHDLGNIFRYFFKTRAPGLFKSITGKTFSEFEKFKKSMQVSDWSGRDGKALTKGQIKYGAFDVKLTFPCYQLMCDAVQEWVLKEEKRLPPNRGMVPVIGLEHALLPMFAKMEQEGILFDSDYYSDYVIPLMESERDKAYRECARFKQLIWRDSSGSNRVLFQVSEPVTDDLNRAKNLLALVFGKKIHSIYRKTTKNKSGHQVEIRWIGPAVDRVIGVLRQVLTEAKGYHVQDSILINLRSPNLKDVLSQMVGFKVHNCQEKYLKKLYDPTNPRTEVIKYLMWYRKNAGYCSRYGRNILNRVLKNGFIHPHWHQIGSEKGEVVSGRTSASDPPIMQMASRAVLYRYTKDDEGVSAAKLLRSAYIAEPGCIFIDGDYSQIEPRITAELTRDKLLTRIYMRNIDLYDVTAQIIFEDEYAAPIDPPEGLSKKGIERWLKKLTAKQKKQREDAKHQRDFSKMVRLGTTYGMGYKSLYRHILDERPDWQVYDRKKKKMRPGTEDDVKDILERLNDSHPGVVKFIKDTEFEATKKLVAARSLAPFRAKKHKQRMPFGKVYSMFGRHRRFCILPDHERADKFDEEELHRNYNPTDENYFYNEFKKRCNKVRLAAFNHKIQATSADITKHAELYLYRWLEDKIENHGWHERKNRIALVLHDEILLQVEEQHAEEAREVMEKLMLKAGRKFLKRIPVEVNLGSGPNWYIAGSVEKSKKKAKSESIYKKSKRAA